LFSLAGAGAAVFCALKCNAPKAIKQARITFFMVQKFKSTLQTSGPRGGLLNYYDNPLTKSCKWVLFLCNCSLNNAAHGLASFNLMRYYFGEGFLHGLQAIAMVLKKWGINLCQAIY